MFLRSNEFDQSSGAAATTLDRAAPLPARRDGIGARLREIDLAPDLGARIGSAEWCRGAATCAALIALTVLLSPGLERPIYGWVPAQLSGSAFDEARAQSIAPIALGSSTGYRMAATGRVRPLTDTPERPIIDVDATIAPGDSFARVLERAGVGGAEAARALALVGGSVDPATIPVGTRVNLTLGRRDSPSDPRPLQKLAFRARFDLALQLDRGAGGLALTRIPIAIDHTPLRIRGRVGASLYRSARAAGAPAKAVELFLRSIAARVPVGRLDSDAQFDLIVEQARAETGEVRLGALLFAGVDAGGRRVQLVRWDEGGRTEWLDPMGRGERTGTMSAPVAAHVSSGFGMRRHPVLGFVRMHKGMDFGAAWGTPVRSTSDGVIAFAGRSGGYGNFVRVNHGGGLATGYGHLSRFAVRSGVRVSRGQVIGYVGSTGLSTGPHLHYELYRNGVAVNPASVSFTTVKQLAGDALSQFRSRYAQLMAVPSDSVPAGN